MKSLTLYSLSHALRGNEQILFRNLFALRWPGVDLQQRRLLLEHERLAELLPLVTLAHPQ
jgi:hypothetical protein